MDDETYSLLTTLQLDKVTLIRLKDFEDEELLKIKPTRTAVEYFWTITPSLPLYVLKINPEIQDIAYLDADTFFYSTPQPIYDEFVNYDALIVKHNYSPQFAQKEKESGTYNVELLIFRNNENAQRILHWWRDRCIEWCFFRYEDGKLGDQLYLNDWTERFTRVRVLKHIGGGVAPWNVDKYDLRKVHGKLMVDDMPLIFYHFHAFRWYHESHFHGIQTYEPAENYWFSWTVKRYIYRPYLKTLKNSLHMTLSVRSEFSKGFHDFPKRNPLHWFDYIVRTLQSHQFGLYMLCSAIFIVLLNTWLWPTSDEFFYGLITKAFLAASHGEIHWSDIDTEHTGLVPFVSFLWNSIFHPKTFLSSRLVMLVFSLGTLALLYNISKAAKLDRTYWMWSLWLLLLIPGFWIFSMRLMLDFPALFSITLLSYLLIRKAPGLRIGLAFLLLLLIKEYYIYIIALLIVCTLILDTILYPTHYSLFKRLIVFCKNIVVIFLPSLIAIILLLDFNIFPYPRLLESSLLFVLGDVFIALNKGILFLLGSFALSIASAAPADIAQATTLLTTTGAYLLKTIASSYDSLQNATSLVNTDVSLVNTASNLAYTGSIGDGVVQSTANYPAQNFFTRIWWIYKYNLSDVDVTLLVLPLAIMGVTERAKVLVKNIRKNYIRIRPDIIMGILFLMFVYFNYHEANNQHGFRITLGIAIPLIYFGIYGVRSLVERFSWNRTILFCALTLIMLFAYWMSIQDITYGSVLSQASLFSTLFAYKNYVFIGGYVIMAFIIVIFSKIRFQYKYWALLLLLLVFFISKFVPFYFDHKLSLNTYGYYYGVYDAGDLLQALSTKDSNIYSNFHHYKVQYIAQDPRIPNVKIFPKVRTFKVIYPERFVRFPLDDTFMKSVITLNIQYVFIVNDQYNESELKTFQDIQKYNPGRFEIVGEKYKNDRLQWRLYKVVTPQPSEPPALLL
ncbi:MAG: hypothetical protein A3B74_04200 [Candidatus Kerfeldbacteria bacterium RIFCSPHIGHO2_02_FULL_42_14]|uniref:Uncharacterized protein n=1 Tax=Candidatus Kerfeldbacteria bacterium RIFCSPHIGHO2_02_FULL_42_14 TaxID=1798540 RepID=A0A1G2ASE8_9BACT|nr:MAG: hypothetical protein A3B74_04200 [Candidatus Kerfeldbacteria bacterium RIFCSPHIGHO2_02_FULL_42_14]OGY82338.1 MAG: hypothetical protein A3E60_01560 [Candidatus Kerfeldbacteria bacterium RIFCSPHIGHO2_12_FULL_42_13]OGY84644.1 MAG: hypothetical protein A3I91_00405 [Candidatus Kerfeldbacteria bacterium RIFCSPLOWO2_02_FULL_42_19]OGY85861.1 MAG: hypothetical protein A3G01_04360 [Candidatus Kerfeldbacteria bacterium RIFCSPLOWO2_12_FULL_43_9]